MNLIILCNSIVCGTNVSRSLNSHFHPHSHFYHVLWNRNWAVQAAMGMGMGMGMKSAWYMGYRGIWEQKTGNEFTKCCEG